MKGTEASWNLNGVILLREVYNFLPGDVAITLAFNPSYDALSDTVLRIGQGGSHLSVTIQEVELTAGQEELAKAGRMNLTRL